jgi:hypothetical protein
MARKQAEPEVFTEVPDPEAERLRRDLADREQELERLRAEIAARDAAAQPFPDSGPGTYRVTCRHAVGALKRWVGAAENERDAWAQYQRAAVKAAYNPNDKQQREVQAVEAFFRHGAVHGFHRTIEKVVGRDAKGRDVFPAELRLEAHRAQSGAGREWKEALRERIGDVAELAEHVGA